MSLEPSDLNVHLNFALVCSGRMGDLAKLRDVVRTHPEVKLVFQTMSSDYLFIVKKGNMTAEQLKAFEKKTEK